MVEEYFNIHDLVKLKVESNITSKVTTVLAQLREFQTVPLDNDSIDIYIYDYLRCPNFKNVTILGEHYYYSNNYLRIPKEKFCFNFIDKPFTVYCDHFIIPLNFIIELVLLVKGYSFIHSAAVEYRGRNYLFPAFGGTGKTTTVSAIVHSGGKLYGDDMNIINDREILNYPSDFSVYPYHLDILDIKDKKIKNKFKKTKILDRITNELENYKFRVCKLLILVLNSFKTPCINIAPRAIFGEDCIVRGGKIDEIYYLSRAENDLSEISIENIDSNELAEICRNVLLQEWQMAMPVIYTYSGLSPFSVNSILDRIRDLFGQTFLQYKCYQITIPNSLGNLAYQRQLISYLTNLDIKWEVGSNPRKLQNHEPNRTHLR